MLQTTSINRFIFLLTSLLMLLAVACTATDGNETPAVNVNINEPVVTVQPGGDDAAAPEPSSTNADYSNLPALPGIGSAAGGSIPTSLGVSEDMGAAPAVAPMSTAVMGGSVANVGVESAYGRGGGGGGFGYSPGYYGMLSFGNTSFILQTTLPEGPAAANVWQSPSSMRLTVEEAREIALRFGFPPELYLDYYNYNMPTPGIYPGDEGAPRDYYQPTPNYYAFDGAKTLSIYGLDVSYNDVSGSNMYGPFDYMPYDQARVVAEAFLQERGLLDYPHVFRKSYWGEEVQIYRLIDGREVINPDFTVTVNGNGVITYLYYSRMSEVITAQEYPLISAAAAWELLQQGVDYNRVFYNIYPKLDENGQVVPYPATSSFMPGPTNKYYPRQYQEGETIDLYPYLMGYVRAEGSGTPRIMGDQFRILAADEVLEELINQVGQQIFISGTIVQVAPNVQAIQLNQWQPVRDYPEYRYEAGVLTWENGQAIFTADVGLTWILPNVPTEIADGTRVFVNGWLPPGVAQSSPQVLNWQTIEEMPSGIPGVDEITITQVDMVYTISYMGAWDGNAESNLLQPAWRFRGTTSLGETIEIFVQAVDPAFITP